MYNNSVVLTRMFVVRMSSFYKKMRSTRSSSLVSLSQIVGAVFYEAHFWFENGGILYSVHAHQFPSILSSYAEQKLNFTPENLSYFFMYL